MNPAPHFSSIRAAFVIGLMVFVLPVFETLAAPSDPQAPPTLRARITRHPGGAVSFGEALRYKDSKLELRVNQGVVILPGESIAAIEFEMPDEIQRAAEAYRAGRVEEAARLYERLRGFGSLAAVPGSSIAVDFLNWADSLRQLRQYGKAQEILQEIEYGDNQDARARASLIQAFIHCDRNELDAAEAILRDFRPTDRGDLNFPLDRIVRTRILLAQGRLHDAALVIGESIASTPIESPIYPELLYLAAACYEKMGEAAEARARGQAVNQADLLMGQDVDYSELVKGVRQELTFLFPNSFWAKRNPVTVDELLAAAAKIKDGEQKEGAADGTGEGEEAQPSPTPESPWKQFLDQLKDTRSEDPIKP